VEEDIVCLKGGASSRICLFDG